jgi:hypothetical protein
MRLRFKHVARDRSHAAELSQIVTRGGTAIAHRPSLNPKPRIKSPGELSKKTQEVFVVIIRLQHPAAHVVRNARSLQERCGAAHLKL